MQSKHSEATSMPATTAWGSTGQDAGLGNPTGAGSKDLQDKHRTCFGNGMRRERGGGRERGVRLTWTRILFPFPAPLLLLVYFSYSNSFHFWSSQDILSSRSSHALSRFAL